MRCKFVRPPLSDKSLQLIQFLEFLRNNAFQRAENLADSDQRAVHVCDREKLANNKADYQRKKQAHVQQ